MVSPAGRPRSGALDAVLGQRIRERRLKLSLTQSELGLRLGITFQQVQKYENGSNRVSALMLVKLAHALELGVTDLLHDIDEARQGDSQAERLLAHFADIKTPEVREAVLAIVKRLAEADS